MKIPKNIIVFGAKYKVKFVDTDLFMGLCDSAKKTIFLNINQSKEQLIATFIHEIVHAMQFTLAYNQAISREMMEIMAENTAVLFMELLKLK